MLLLEVEKVRKFSSTQFNLPEYLAKQVLKLTNKIPDEDLADDGKEDTPHITAKFGLHTDDPNDVKKLISNFGPIKIKIGKISLFNAENFDVVKMDVTGDKLFEINKLISTLKNGDKHPTYKPHITLAYVKKGKGDQYCGESPLTGKEFSVNKLTFSGKTPGDKTIIPLTKEDMDFKGWMDESL